MKRLGILLVLLVAMVLSAGATSLAAGTSVSPLRVGALYPLSGDFSSLAQQEYDGVEIATQMVNQRGGVNGRAVQLDTQVMDFPSQATSRVAALKADGVPVILGTYSSSLSIPASRAAHAAGITYWESGAVANQVTGSGYSDVFRVGASGSNLGDNSASFTATQLAPRLHLAPAQVRVSVVYANDAYGSSVGDAAITTARAQGLDVVSITPYDPYLPDWNRVFETLQTAHPTVVILASYVLDGVAFRDQMLARHFHTDALIGSTMAECGPDFGNLLGPAAVGVFASDRPGTTFNPKALLPAARSTYDQFAVIWKQRYGGAPTEEGLAGFSSAWALFVDVLPHAQSMTPAAIAAAAWATRLPQGSLPDGAGIDFSHSPASMGQNLRAAAVVWQWQAPYHSVVVWPQPYTNGTITDLPLPN